MSPKRFRRLLDVHGADLARWPAHARAAATRRVATDPEARQVLDAARRLEALLIQAPVPASTEAVRQRLAALQARLPAQQRPFWWPAPIELWDLLPRWPRAAALGVMAAAGIIVGLTDLDGSMSPAASADVSADVSGLVFDPNPAIGLGR